MWRLRSVMSVWVAPCPRRRDRLLVRVARLAVERRQRAVELEEAVAVVGGDGEDVVRDVGVLADVVLALVLAVAQAEAQAADRRSRGPRRAGSRCSSPRARG